MVKTASTMANVRKIRTSNAYYAYFDSTASKWCKRIGWIQMAIGLFGLMVVPIMMANFEELTIPGRDFLKVANTFYKLRVIKWANWNNLAGAYWSLLGSVLCSSVFDMAFGLILVVGTCKEKEWMLQIWSWDKTFDLGTATWQILKATFYSSFGIDMIGIMVQVPLLLVILIVVELRIRELKDAQAPAEPSGSSKV